MTHDTSKDFFLSYTQSDRAWAEWIAWQLEAEGYSAILQAWDFRPGSNFILEVDRAAKEAQRTIAVLSPDYLEAISTQPEWAAALRQDPTGAQGKLLPVRVRECHPTGLLEVIVPIDLVGLNALTAQNTLLTGIHRTRIRPSIEPGFPGKPSSLVSQIPSFPGNWPELWQVPYRRNLFFTGREQYLRYICEQLNVTKATALTQTQAINGLGGIGKTQIALEYAYRYGYMYRIILWITAATEETIISDFHRIAIYLNIVEQNEQDQHKIVAAVLSWLSNQQNWLIIFDNADDLTLVHKYLPSGNVLNGQILLTTRSHALGNIAHPIDISKMDREESTLLLLRRIRNEQVTPQQKTEIGAIVEVLDGLPLAIDQAGAYIEETECSLEEYLHLLQTHQNELLQERGTFATDHPDAVAKTWSISFEKVNQTNPAATDILNLCTFLSPDAIQEEIITKGASALSPLLQNVAQDHFLLNKALRSLLNYSLIHRNPDHTLTIHRLVQAVLKHNMDQDTQRLWTERVINSVQLAFPEVTYANWQDCQQYLPHIQVCAALVEQWGLTSNEAAELFADAADYLDESAQYKQAEEFSLRALKIKEQLLGLNHPDLTGLLHSMVHLYEHLGKYEEAIPFHQRELAIHEQVHGTNHPETAVALHSLARLYQTQGKYEQAESSYLRALAIREQALGPEHSETATTLIGLAHLYQTQGKYEQAESSYLRALAIREQALGLEHPWTAIILRDIADLYHEQGKYEQAESYFQQALATHKQALGLEHPRTAIIFRDIADLYHAQGKYEQAESYFQQALATHKQVLGLEHPETATTLQCLANLYQAQRKYEQAEFYFQQTLAIREQALGSEHPETATTLQYIANLCQEQGKYEQAESYFQRALAIREQALGLEHSDTAAILNDLAALYQKQGKYKQAESYFQQALAIREQALGLEHPQTAETLLSLAILYDKQSRHKQTESFLQRALTICEKALGPEHPQTAETLHYLAHHYEHQRKYEQAEEAHLRELEIREKILGPEHHRIAESLRCLARIYELQHKYKQAESFLQRALIVCEKALGPEDLYTASVLHSLAHLYQDEGKYEQAEEAHLRELEIREKILGSEHPQVAESLHCLASLYLEQNKYEKAETFFTQSVLITEKSFGPNHPDIAKTLQKLAWAYVGRGNYQRAKTLSFRALTMLKQVVGPKHPDTISAQRNHNAIQQMKGLKN